MMRKLAWLVAAVVGIGSLWALNKVVESDWATWNEEAKEKLPEPRKLRDRSRGCLTPPIRMPFSGRRVSPRPWIYEPRFEKLWSEGEEHLRAGEYLYAAEEWEKALGELPEEQAGCDAYAKWRASRRQ